MLNVYTDSASTKVEIVRVRLEVGEAVGNSKYVRVASLMRPPQQSTRFHTFTFMMGRELAITSRYPGHSPAV